jgi:hypothetical protein
VRTIAANMSEYGTYGRAHVWYGPGQAVDGHHLCSHGQKDFRYATGTGNSMTTMQNSLYIYDTADLMAVAAGTKSPIGLVPTTDAFDMSLLPHSGLIGPFQQTANALNSPWGSQFAAAWFEPVSQLLFVCNIFGEFLGEMRPIAHVFAINC